MKLTLKEPPREFLVRGRSLRHMGDVELDCGEFLSVSAGGGGGCDIAGAEWGLYLGPSLNDRLMRMGYRAALVRTYDNKIFLQAVAENKIELFNNYLHEQNMEVVQWIDNTFGFPENDGK